VAARRGWYQDPLAERWWDGTQWTDLTRRNGAKSEDGPMSDKASDQPAGWRRDPLVERYWNGTSWTSETRIRIEGPTRQPVTETRPESTERFSLPPPPPPVSERPEKSSPRRSPRPRTLIAFALVVLLAGISIGLLSRQSASGPSEKAREPQSTLNSPTTFVTSEESSAPTSIASTDPAGSGPGQQSGASSGPVKEASPTPSAPQQPEPSATAPIEMAPPLIPNVNVSPPTVRPGETITVSVRVEDVSGVARVSVGIVKGGVNIPTPICEGLAFSVSSGDSFSGTWTRTCNIPMDYTNFGDHVIYGTANDTIGNSVSWQGNSLRAVFAVVQ